MKSITFAAQIYRQMGYIDLKIIGDNNDTKTEIQRYF